MPKISSPAGPEGDYRRLPARAIVRAVADAAQRWRDADFPARVRVAAAIEARTGYTTPVVDYALDRLFGSLDAATIEAAIVEELGSLDACDRFVERAAGLRGRAYPVGRVVVISSQTTIGVAIVPSIYALCAKCEVLVKDRDDALVAAFFETLVEERPELARAATARTWTGADESEADLRLRLADTVVAFGRNETLGTIRERLRPGARFVGYGHRASVGYLTREALTGEDAAREIATRAARDLVLYDGEGCMSLHALFVERDAAVSPREVAEHLTAALAGAVVEFPIRRIDPRITAYQSGVAFRAALGRGSVFRTAQGDATVVLDPPIEAAPPFLPRVLPIYSVDGPADCEEYLRSHGLSLEAFAVAEAPPEDGPLLAVAIALRAARIARFGEMQVPSAAHHHGGRARIADFVRWVESY